MAERSPPSRGSSSGESIAYHALLLAVGARLSNRFEHVTGFDDEHADDAYHGIVQLRNVPVAEDGFVPVDEFSRVPDTAEHIFAAGDATNLPIKHGGLGAQQADVAAAGIAALAGVEVRPEPLRPVVRGVLHTGRQPLYITARIEDGTAESEVTTERAWPADEKLVAEELGPFLRSLD